MPSGAWKIVKEVARHLLRRPVIGIVAAARTADGRLLLIRRGDSGKWALPGGTLEWGEDLRGAIEREVLEETGATVTALGELLGTYSKPDRDPRFHAVTVVVGASITAPDATRVNPVEVTEVGLFHDHELPTDYSHGMEDLVQNVVRKAVVWE
ncbi:MAG: NUDIX hydrolase [Myxococcales bacterium]|nr:MAG: NUDIX hydrolase [Myxococcales bacterium]